MSHPSAIAAVTATLQRLIETAIQADGAQLPPSVQPGQLIRCTTLPLDKANEENEGKDRINLFLYQTVVNAALRNMDIPRLNEIGRPPLALNLYYLITAYGEDSSKFIDHLLLGRAMRVLHDHPLLGREELETVLAASDLHRQIERVRITPQPMSVDEMSNLWTTFQTQYRVSAAYQVSVVLIDSRLPRRSSLPVLKRGRDDRGAYVLPSPSPVLREVSLPHDKPGTELGDTLTIHGNHLEAEHIAARFRHLRSFETVDEIPPLPGGTATERQIQLPDETTDPRVLGRWPIGIYALLIVVQRPDLPHWTTNAIPFALVPRITIQQPANRQAPAGTVDLTLICKPQLRADQRAVLLFGNRQVEPHTISTPDNPNPPPPKDPTRPTTLGFQIDHVQPGDHVLRLRVDGVDSLPFQWAPDGQIDFDPNQTLTVT
jgi:hypothetical protein